MVFDIIGFICAWKIRLGKISPVKSRGGEDSLTLELQPVVGSPSHTHCWSTISISHLCVVSLAPLLPRNSSGAFCDPSVTKILTLNNEIR
jgi:hypothetical protein